LLGAALIGCQFYVACGLLCRKEAEPIIRAPCCNKHLPPRFCDALSEKWQQDPDTKPRAVSGMKIWKESGCHNVQKTEEGINIVDPQCGYETDYYKEL